ncbi:MAG: hypothetical protein HY076_08430 [Candidatus Eisenbacteria bacterium]|uniref:Uncharacterized protein n=1 Tax=Eiseniibacteriota bacterium TaxID=2212470 RepID=A0A9D6L7D7_UNCEI|nr:hypothetical protein [Candidatus Eisenbacteria bacterium]MBI3540283.1 hypothetical protein [Candidatus Eisenbacteria bacterium]
MPRSRLARVVVSFLAAIVSIQAAPVRAAGSWDVIVPSLVNATLCTGCGITVGGGALLVNTGPAALTEADLSTATFSVLSSRPDIYLGFFLNNPHIVAPIAPGEAVGVVTFLDDGVFTPNDIFLDSVAPSETFRNTYPIQFIGLGINRDAGSYEGPAVFDVIMQMGGRVAFFTIHADMHLGPHHLTYVEAQRVSSVPGATAARPTTWGAIKKLYR